MGNITLIGIMAVMVLLSALFSASEIASAKSNKLRFAAAAENGDRTAKIVKYINDNYVRSLCTILAGNNFVNIACSSAATILFIGYFGSQGENIASVVTTALLLLLGETCPKIVAAGAPDRCIRIFAWPLFIFMVLLSPLVWAVEKFIALLSPLWTPKNKAPQMTPAELCEVLEEIEEDGVFTEEESDLIRSAIEFTDTTAHEILTPRVDVMAIDIEEFVCGSELSEDMLHYSRIPVYEGTIDNIIGILPVKSLMREMVRGTANIQIRSLLVQPIYVHKTCPLPTIIEEFKQKHAKLAIVLDEFGGTMGIVTLEDILEEIVGDIYDETDIPKVEFTQETDNLFVVDGALNVFDMFAEVGYEPPPDFDTEYTTVSGWATEILDKFPEVGDEFSFDRLKLRVLETKAVRVETLQVELLPEEEEE